MPFDVAGILWMIAVAFVLPPIGIAALVSLLARNRTKLVVLTVAVGVAAVFWQKLPECGTQLIPGTRCTTGVPFFWYPLIFLEAMCAAAIVAWMLAGLFASNFKKQDMNVPDE